MFALLALGLARRVRRTRLRARIHAPTGYAREVLSLGESHKPLSPRYKNINAWISGPDVERTVPLLVGRTYVLNFKVGLPVSNSLISPQLARLLETDIPEGGLDTEWVILSRSVLISPLTSEIKVTCKPTDADPGCKAEFTLHIPRAGESQTVQMGVTPRAHTGAEVEILIFVRDTLYRRFHVELNVATKARLLWSNVLGGGPKPPARINDDIIEGPAAQIGPQFMHELVSPPGEVTIAVLKQGGAYVRENIKFVEGYSDEAEWYASAEVVSGRIDNVREAAERFCSRWEDYLNSIDRDDMLQRLESGMHLNGEASDAHIRAWSEVAASQEMRDLAFHGHALYQGFFPPRTELRRLVDKYDLGWRLNIKWQHNTKDRIPHVPWGLMYRSPPPKRGDPIEPIDFLGLRFRISHTAYVVNNPRFFGLGDPATTFSANCMYWGGGPDDIIRVEAQWQQQVLGQWPNHLFVPSGDPNSQAKDELLAMLDLPRPAPMPVLYIFCQCEVGKGNKPVLRFGPDGRGSETINYTDLSVSILDEQPLVFVNACLSSAAGAYTTNELERIFFERGCSAYIGTETYIPVHLASRFATVFYNYFYRRLDGTLIPAGEAMFQSRHFLWRHYRNVGGLFYCYINKYDLFMATDEEVEGILGWREHDG